MGDVSDEIRDPRFGAAIDLLRRCGASGFEIRYSGRPEDGGPPEYDPKDPVPVVWIAVSDFTGATSTAGTNGYEAAAGLTPLTAALRLADQIVDGGTCVHCRRPARIAHDVDPMPLAKHICWYQFDPELSTYRRSCEGDYRANRNDPCPCGSGLKFKRCHGVSKAGVVHDESESAH